MSTSVLSIIAILAAIGLGAMVSIPGRHRSLNSLFLAAGLLLMAIIEGADRYALSHPQTWAAAKEITLVAESLLGATWLLFASTYARRQPLKELSPFTWSILAASLLLPLAVLISPSADFYFSPDFHEEHILFLEQTAYWFYFAVLVLLVVSLYYLERALMALSSVERSLALYEILGVGIALAALLVYYSQALLHRTIDMNLVPVRSLALLTGVGMCAYSRFKRGGTGRVFLSHDVASRSVVVLVIGCYLLLLGVAGEGLRYFGLQNQRLLFTGFAVISGLLPVLFLLSEKNRRKLKVFLHKHFYRHKYDYRNEWLMFTKQLSSAEDMGKIQEAILAFYCETFARKGASLYLLDTETSSYQQKVSRYLDFPHTCFFADHPMIEYFNQTDWVFSTADNHPSVLDSIKRQLEPFKIELCVPLQYEQNLEGFILLGEAANPDEALNYEDFDLMKVLASQATSVLLSMKLSEQLSTAQEMVAIGRVSTYVIHDLKNHVSNLSLMMDNARDHIDNPEFQVDMLETLDETVGKMNGLITRLKNIKDNKELSLSQCDLAEVVKRAVKALGTSVKIAFKADQAIPVSIDAAEVEKVVHNLILNAHEAGDKDGPVKVEVGMAEMAFFEVSDQGCGMSELFMRNRLFKPFQTTKQNGFGIGMYQCRHIIALHGGNIEVSSKEGEGSSFKVHLPATSV